MMEQDDGSSWVQFDSECHADGVFESETTFYAIFPKTVCVVQVGSHILMWGSYKWPRSCKVCCSFWQESQQSPEFSSVWDGVCISHIHAAPSGKLAGSSRDIMRDVVRARA
jgi:hypothetical protein